MKLRSKSLRVVAIAVVVAIVAPISWAWADDRFVDVPANNSHHANVNAIAAAAITLGCSDSTHYCPEQLVRRDQMASFLARLGGLGSNTRVANGKGQVSAYCAVANALPGRFERGPCNGSARIFEATGALTEPSIALDVTGQPVVGYLSYNGPQTEAQVIVARCPDAACVGHTTMTIGNTRAQSGLAIAVGADGNILAFYEDRDTLQLQIARCRDFDCTGVDRLNLTAGDHPSIVIGNDGIPVVGFRDGGARIQRCTDIVCSGALEPLTFVLSPGAAAGEYNDLTIAGDGVPTMSFYERTGGDLYVGRCVTRTCESLSAPVALASSSDVGSHTAIATGIDGNPVIAHYDAAFDRQAVTRCADVQCSSAASTAYRSPMLFTSIALLEDGTPVVAGYNTKLGYLSYAVCTTRACTSLTDGVGDPHQISGIHSSMIVGTDGVPVVVSVDSIELDIRISRLPLPRP